MSDYITLDTTGVEYFSISNFTFSTGETLDIKVAYRSYNPTFPHSTSFGGRINSTLTFTSGALASHHVLVVAMLGNGESSSPSNTPPFPKSLHYQDCINAQHLLLTQHLKITTLDAVLGFSMGGQQAYYWAVMHSSLALPPPASPSPLTLKSVIAICASAKTSGFNYTGLEGPIAALETSFDYAKGQYRSLGVKPTEGLRAFGRAYAACLTCPEWFRREMWTEMGASSLKAWLNPPVGFSVFESWDAEDVLCLARMWQDGDVGTLVPEGDYGKALEGVWCKVLLMPSRTDQYFRYEDSEVEMKFLKKGTLAVIESEWGHIAGAGTNAVDIGFMDGQIREFLDGAEAGNQL